MAEGRDETFEERLDRKWGELLQELRVMQTGAQLTAAFLLTLPFQSAFEDLDAFQTGLYLALVLLAVATTAFVLTPVAIHRRITGQRVKERLVTWAHRMAACGLLTLGALVTGIVMLVFDMVLDRTWAAAVAGATAVVLVALLAALPHRLLRNQA
ncbi:DUF6328 family protein [Nocardioides sp. GCM10027113]|uniref:DUF6328 family protein n=1 Tax=unclassified Nocardioides TaxID=2615069 RepID=UPI003615DF17